MSTKSLEFRTLPGLWQSYADHPPSLAFKAGNREAALSWQSQLRFELTRLLGGFPERACDLSPRHLKTREMDGFTCDTMAIQTRPDEYMPCFVLTPHTLGNPPLKPVIALHGHGTWGAEAIIHSPQDPQGAALNRELNYEYAGELARRGYLVFVPELRGFGRRLEDPLYQEGESQRISSCYAVGVNALLLGQTLLGLRVYDVIRLVDYIRTRPESLTHTLGCVGLSGGGMVTLFTTALDLRITCAVVSGYFNTFRDSIMAVRHCLCNFVPGLARVVEMVDIAGLVAPRPLLVESGTQDPIFPATATQQAYQELGKIYELFGAPDALDIDVFEGPHAWSGAKAYHWLERFL